MRNGLRITRLKVYSSRVVRSLWSMGAQVMTACYLALIVVCEADGLKVSPRCWCHRRKQTFWNAKPVVVADSPSAAADTG
jgi:hypothetical protein